MNIYIYIWYFVCILICAYVNVRINEQKTHSNNQTTNPQPHQPTQDGSQHRLRQLLVWKILQPKEGAKGENIMGHGKWSWMSLSDL